MRSLWLTVACGVPTTPVERARHSPGSRVFPDDSTVLPRACKPGRSRSPRPRAPGRLKGDESGGSGRQRLPTGGNPRRCACLQTQVREGLLDHRLPGHGGPGVVQAQTVLWTVCVRAHLQDRGDDLQLAATVQAALQIALESEASAKTDLYSLHVLTDTRSSSLPRLSRTGRWRARFAAPCALRPALVPANGPRPAPPPPRPRGRSTPACRRAPAAPPRRAHSPGPCRLRPSGSSRPS